MTDFSAAFADLSAILKPYRAKSHIKTDKPDQLYLEIPGPDGKPQLFAAVMVKKSYVAFHLFPLYTHPDLLGSVSDELQKRMQGKSCFNFKVTDAIELAALRDLTSKAWATIG